MVAAKNTGHEYVIAGDLNSQSSLWGSPVEDRRGEYLAEWAAELNLIFLNTGESTFVRRNSATHIDISRATQKIAKNVSNWQTLDGEFLTEDKHIT
ncbi:hypothetical protein JTB14_010058 [Gonioctena quinquepunctata]|nr:hypothetical protein JTB14_010058 [Gonioctena quinquepunctata]